MRGHDYGKPLSAMTAYLDGMAEARSRATAARAPTHRSRSCSPRWGRRWSSWRATAPPAPTPTSSRPSTPPARAHLLGPGPLLAPEHAVVVEDDPDLAREVARGFLTLYLALPNYSRNLETLGFDQGDFADGGSDRLVDALVAWGDAETVVAKLGAHREAGADHVAIQPLARRPSAASWSSWRSSRRCSSDRPAARERRRLSQRS